MTIEIVGGHSIMSYNYVLKNSTLAVSFIEVSYVFINAQNKWTDTYNKQGVCNPTERCV